MVRIVNHILINVVVVSFAFVLAVPAEVFVVGIENHFTPTVEDADFKIIYLILNRFGK